MMNSTVKLRGNADLAAKQEEKLARFEEFHKKREKERQERLARIESRKLELQSRRTSEVQKKQTSLHQPPVMLKQPHQTKTPVASASQTQTTSVKSRLVPTRPVQSGSTVERQITAEISRRNTISSRIFTPTVKNPMKENLLRKSLTSLDKENLKTVHSSSKTSNIHVKRQIVAESNVQRQSLKAKDVVNRPKFTQNANGPQKLAGKTTTASNLPRNSTNNERVKKTSEGLPTRPEDAQSERKMTRQEELELWRHKRQQEARQSRPTAIIKPRILDSARKSDLKPKSSTVKTSSSSVGNGSLGAKNSAGKPAFGASKARSEIQSAGSNKRLSAGTKTVLVANRARSLPSTSAQTPGRSGTEPVGKHSLERPLKSPLEEKSENAPEPKSHRPVTMLETIFSEPSTPETRPPRMSTPFSNRRAATPGEALALSSILGSKVKRFTSTWTPTTPKTPHAAMRKRLSEWLEAHGKTPSRYRHLACHGVHAREMSTPVVMKKPTNRVLDSTFQSDVKYAACDEAEAEFVEKNVLEMLSEVISLVREGYPPEELSAWHRRLSSKIPNVESLARFWVLKAYLAAVGPGGKPEAVQILEEGLRNNAKPSEELENLRAVVNQSMEAAVTRTPGTRLTNEVQSENIFESSAVKFSLKRVPVLQSTENIDSPGRRSARKSCVHLPQNVVITPVRRSTRKSCGHLPIGLRDHDTIVESVDEVPIEDRPMSLFRSNVALNLNWQFGESEVETK